MRRSKRYWYERVSPRSLVTNALRFRTRELIMILGQPVVKKLVRATGAENYNILQNNGRLAHQVVDHVRCLNDWV